MIQLAERQGSPNPTGHSDSVCTIRLSLNAFGFDGRRHNHQLSGQRAEGATGKDGRKCCSKEGSLGKRNKKPMLDYDWVVGLPLVQKTRILKRWGLSNEDIAGMGADEQVREIQD